MWESQQAKPATLSYIIKMRIGVAKETNGYAVTFINNHINQSNTTKPNEQNKNVTIRNKKHLYILDI